MKQERKTLFFFVAVWCQIEGEDAGVTEGETGEGEPAVEETSLSPESLEPTQTNTVLPDVIEDGSGASGEPPDGDSPSDFPSLVDGEDFNITIILIPVVLVILIIAMIAVGIYISRRWNSKAANKDSKMEDTYMDASTSEKVPMPMFEEDVPSVLELEMEELDQWINPDS